MKKLIFSIAIFIPLLVLSLKTSVFADNYEWKCGNLFVGKGIHSFSVIEYCGEPNIKEDVGYLQKKRNTVLKEKWVYGPYSGYYYVIYIKAGLVDKVESIKT
jgi:hypothetical protein